MAGSASGGFGHGVLGAASAAVASYLWITPAELRTELMVGKTLAQIAVAHNKTADGVVSTLLADAKKKLDAAVTDKKLTADQEQTFLDRLKTLLTDASTGSGPSRLRACRCTGSRPRASRVPVRSARRLRRLRLQVPAAACALAAASRVALAAQFRLPKIDRKNRKTLRMSRKIDAASSGAPRMSFDFRRRWKSNIVKPAKMTSPRIA